MKRLIILLLSCIPIVSTAQALSEAQKQEALQCATKFCDLLERFCNGERTLNPQINALCSGADCSAYDDIKENKEVTLRNYLIAIQHEYTDKLATSISAPDLSKSKSYIEPVVSVDTEWGTLGNGNGGELSTAEIAVLSVDKVSNVYIVFDVIQTYPSLGKSISKKIVYDSKNKKITAFITNTGTLISYLNGLIAFSNKQYDAAISYFDSAAQSNRSSLRKRSYELAKTCAAYMGDWERSLYYAEKVGDPLYINVFKLQIYTQNESWDKAYQSALQLESLLSKRTDLNNIQKSGLYIMLANVYANPVFQHQDLHKALSYLEAAHSLGDAKSGYLIFVLYTVLGDGFVTPEKAFEYLQKSAAAGYPPAFYDMGRLAEYGHEDKEAALAWYEKSAKSGNHLAMASAGKLLIEKGETSEGVEWLKKSLQGKALEAELKDRESSTGLAPWPKTRADVESLLNEQEGTTSHQDQIPADNPPTYHNHSTQTSPTATVSGSTSSTHPGNHPYRPRHRFNEEQVKTIAGFSVGYVQKQWIYDWGNKKEKLDVFGEDKYTNGIQAGIRIDPQFGYGLGMNTGLYYEFYFDKSEDMNEDGIEYHYRSEEHSLYLPVHLKYALNFSKWFQLALYGGIGLDYGVSGKIYLRSDDETGDTRSLYDNELDIKRFNASLEYGAAVKINRIQLNFTTSKGFVNMSGSEEYQVKQNKMRNIALSVCF